MNTSDLLEALTSSDEVKALVTGQLSQEELSSAIAKRIHGEPVLLCGLRPPTRMLSTASISVHKTIAQLEKLLLCAPLDGDNSSN